VNDTQLILNRIALRVGGGPTGGDMTGLYRGVGGIAGVKACWAILPDIGTFAQDGVLGVVFAAGSRRILGDAGDLTVWKHDVRLQLLLSIARSDLALAIAKLQPFVPLVVNRFDTEETWLGGTATNGSLIREVTGPREAVPLYEGRVALEFAFDVEEEAAVAYA
jgi:hypothetical protein